MKRSEWPTVVLFVLIVAALIAAVVATNAEAAVTRLSRHPRTFVVGVTDTTTATVGDTVYTVPADVAMLIGGSTPPVFFLKVTSTGMKRVPNLGSVLYIPDGDGSTAQYISDQDGNVTRRWVNIVGMGSAANGYIIGY